MVLSMFVPRNACFVFGTSYVFVGRCTRCVPGESEYDTPRPLLTQVTLEGGGGSEVYHMYFVTYATDWPREFCVMGASASAYGFRLNVLGEGRQAHFEQD